MLQNLYLLQLFSIIPENFKYVNLFYKNHYEFSEFVK